MGSYEVIPYLVSDILDGPWSRLSSLVHRTLIYRVGGVTRHAHCIYDVPHGVRTRYPVRLAVALLVEHPTYSNTTSCLLGFPLSGMFIGDQR